MKKFIVATIAVLSILVVYSTKSEAQQYGGYCCDGYGYRQCVLNAPAPVGSNCFCYGKGWGFTCQ